MTVKKKPTTIRDIARQAEVSYQTVSLVINGKPGVSETTRKRILRLMEEMEYRPNRAAQMLTTNRSNTLELIIVDVDYGGRLADSTKNMAHAAKQEGYSLLFSETDHDGLQDALENAKSRLVDGILLYAPRLQIADDELMHLSNGIPLVRRDYMPGSRLAWVGFDQVYATRLATEHLIERGHRHIAAIPPVSDIHNGYWRALTWKNVLLERGFTPGPSYPGDYSMGSGYQAMCRILETGEKFTAVLAGTDNMAVGAMRALREHGLRIPEDVSVVGFDNTELSLYTEPPLTTVGFKFEKQDMLAVRYLIDIIHDPDMEFYQQVLMAEIIVRESTRSITDE